MKEKNNTRLVVLKVGVAAQWDRGFIVGGPKLEEMQPWFESQIYFIVPWGTGCGGYQSRGRAPAGPKDVI